MKVHLSLILFLFCVHLNAQNSPSFDLSDLYFYSDVMVNADSEIHRLRANNTFNELFQTALKQPESYNIPLEKIPYISCIMPKDSSFKLFSYNYVEDSGVSKDFGVIQLKNGTLIHLTPEKDLQDIEYEELDANRWVSGLYYHMVPFTNNGEQYYLLFGFSQPSIFEKRKVLDILSIKDGEVRFGKDLFVQHQNGVRDIRKNRRIYYYSADAVMTIRDDKDLQAIVVDHLMEVKSRIPGNPNNAFVPDGTYTAYFLENGEWVYKDKLWDEHSVNKFEKEESENKPKSTLFGN